ncbi:MAG: hypothetical protein ACI9TB_002691, partial [Parasphingorhabdus sp.]
MTHRISKKWRKENMTFELPPLPYAKTAFGDLISEET